MNLIRGILNPKDAVSKPDSEAGDAGQGGVASGVYWPCFQAVLLSIRSFRGCCSSSASSNTIDSASVGPDSFVMARFIKSSRVNRWRLKSSAPNSFNTVISILLPVQWQSQTK